MFTLPDLPYAYDALEPYIDEGTMLLHHGKHHQTYVDKLNAAIKGTEYEDAELTELLQNIDNLPSEMQLPVRHNGGGHYNHTFFWNIMSPDGGGELPSELDARIATSFGDLETFKDKFAEAAVSVFGSGWVWLIEENGQLMIERSPLQDSPMMRGIEPALGLDVWEHAYYLKYQNKRPDYIEAWWSVVNWEEVAKRLG